MNALPSRIVVGVVLVVVNLRRRIVLVVSQLRVDVRGVVHLQVQPLSIGRPLLAERHVLPAKWAGRSPSARLLFQSENAPRVSQWTSFAPTPPRHHPEHVSTGVVQEVVVSADAALRLSQGFRKPYSLHVRSNIPGRRERHTRTGTCVIPGRQCSNRMLSSYGGHWIECGLNSQSHSVVREQLMDARIRTDPHRRTLTSLLHDIYRVGGKAV